MKRAITFFLIFFVLTIYSETSLAQDSFRGSMIMGGECKLNFNRITNKLVSEEEEEDINRITALNMSPFIGWFVSDNLVLGFNIPINMSWDKVYGEDYISKSSLISICLAPGFRHYFQEGNVRPFIEGNIGLGKAFEKSTQPVDSWYDTYYEEITNKANLFSYSISGGMSIFLNLNLALDFSLGYGYATLKPKENNDSNMKIESSSIGSNIGFTIIF